jgi:hypothetical protein
MRAAALILCLWSAAAVANAAQPAPPHEVSPLTVFPGAGAPNVAATFPAAGQAISPGVLILTATFNQPMADSGFDIEAAAGGQAPDCLKTPRLLDDGKTFAWLCTTAPGAAYAVAFNAGASGGFANTAGQRAQPATLSFTTTSAEDGPRDVEAALKVAKLKPSDLPIEREPSAPAPAAPAAP